MTILLTVLAAVVGTAVGWAGWGYAERTLLERDEDIAPLPPRTRVPAAVAGAALFAATVSVIGVNGVLPAYLWFVAATLLLFITDLHAQLIPDRISRPALTIGAALLFVGAIIDGTSDALSRAAISGAAFFALLLVVYIVGRGQSFGGGDVKLAPLLGLFTGYLGWSELVAAIVLGFLLGGVVAIALLILRLKAAKEHFAFGPVLILGAYAAIVWGAPLMDWYLR